MPIYDCNGIELEALALDGVPLVVIPRDDTDPPDDSEWLPVFEARDFSGLDSWYVANTGARYTPTNAHDDELIDTAWLNSKLGNGNVTQINGRWFVERMSAGNFRVVADNITFRDCTISSGGNYHGISSYVGENPTGIVIEYCTIDGQGGDWLGITFGNAYNVGQITARRNNILGYRCGIQIIGGFTAEENWIHDLAYPDPDPHVSGISIRARNVTVRRNRIADGNSSALAFYDENQPYTNIVAEQNVISTQQSLYEVSYPGTASVGHEVSLIDNLLERGSIANGFNFTTKMGNVNAEGHPV